MTDPMPAFRILSSRLAQLADGLGLKLVQFDCAQAFPDGQPRQEFFQAVFTLSTPVTEPDDDSQDRFDEAFADLQAQLVLEKEDEELQNAIREAQEHRERLLRKPEDPHS